MSLELQPVMSPRKHITLYTMKFEALVILTALFLTSKALCNGTWHVVTIVLVCMVYSDILLA